VAAGKRFAPIRGRRMRLTRLDECGAPVVGPASTGVSKGFVSVGMAPQYEDADPINMTNAAGEIDFNEVGDATLTGMQAEIAFTRVDPDLFSLITNQQTVVDYNAVASGFRLSGGQVVTGAWALEVWSDLGGQACVGGKSYGYFLLPFLRGGTVGDFSVENGAANFTVTSATRENSQWGTGPYNVVHRAPTGTEVGPQPSKLLTAIGPKDHFHLEMTPVAPPAVTDGLVALA
jgi:hypothetical protein